MVNIIFLTIMSNILLKLVNYRKSYLFPNSLKVAPSGWFHSRPSSAEFILKPKRRMYWLPGLEPWAAGLATLLKPSHFCVCVFVLSLFLKLSGIQRACRSWQAYETGDLPSETPVSYVMCVTSKQSCKNLIRPDQRSAVTYPGFWQLLFKNPIQMLAYKM